MSSIPFLVSLSLAAWGSVAAGQDLREQIRKHGNVEVLILKEYSPVDLPTLVASAGTIGRVLITQSKSSLVGYFTVSFGSQGAFRVEQGKVTQVSQDTGTWNRDRGAVALVKFLQEIAAAKK